MWLSIVLALLPFHLPRPHGFLEAVGFYLVRAAAVEVPQKLYGNTRLRVDEVLIGPGGLKGTESTYRFFRPKQVQDVGGGSRYTGAFPDFAFPAPKDHTRLWWASPDGKGGWTTANFWDVCQYIPRSTSEILLKVDLKPDSPEGTTQADFVVALLRLEKQRTRVGQIAVLRDLRVSEKKHLFELSDKLMLALVSPPPKRKR